MNSRDRLSLAMRHLRPDRTPVMCQLALGHYFLHAGLAPRTEPWKLEMLVPLAEEPARG